jgi:ABC-type long-subunit fatty acid transport system fused permease/ATPase subunit
VLISLIQKQDKKTFKLFQSRERELMNKYKYVVSLWRRLSNVAGETRYGDAMRFLHTLEEATSSFVREVNATVGVLHPIHCTKERKVKVEVDMTTIPAFIIVLILLYAVLRPRAPKPKIN